MQAAVVVALEMELAVQVALVVAVLALMVGLQPLERQILAAVVVLQGNRVTLAEQAAQELLLLGMQSKGDGK
jgi:hypothetical protein